MRNVVNIARLLKESAQTGTTKQRHNMRKNIKPKLEMKHCSQQNLKSSQLFSQESDKTPTIQVNLQKIILRMLPTKQAPPVIKETRTRNKKPCKRQRAIVRAKWRRQEIKGNRASKCCETIGRENRKNWKICRKFLRTPTKYLMNCEPLRSNTTDARRY